MKDEKLTFFLSPGELFCIAGSLGLATLPLVGNHYRGWSQEDIRKDINKGREVLESRGLIKHFGLRQWEVDDTLSSLVEFIAYPEYALVASSWRKNETNQQAFLYFKTHQSLTLTFKDRFFNLTLYREIKSVSRYVYTVMGVNAQLSSETAHIELPIIDLGTLFQNLWAEAPENAPAVLKAAGIGENDRLVEQLNQIITYSNLTLLSQEGGRFNRSGQLFLLANLANVWVSEILATAPAMLDFYPQPVNKANQHIDRYLRGKVIEEAANDDEEKALFV